jgi:hypothetical protein
MLRAEQPSGVRDGPPFAVGKFLVAIRLLRVSFAPFVVININHLSGVPVLLDAPQGRRRRAPPRIESQDRKGGCVGYDKEKLVRQGH